MAKISIQAGATSVTLPIFVQASTSTQGLGLTGLLGTSAGLQAWYYRGTGTAVQITLTTSSLNAPYTSGLFVEVNSTATGIQGAYRFDPPDAAFATASNVRSCLIGIGGAANMAPVPLEVELTAWNNQDSTAGGINNLLSGGTLGSVSNVRGTATVILAAGVHTGAIVPVVQTASNLINTVVLAPQTHTSAVIPVVQTASVALTANTVGTATTVLSVDTVRTSTVSNITAGAMARFFDLDAGTFSTSSANSVVRQITTNVSAGGGAPSVDQITTAVWAKYGTAVVQLNTGTHTGAIVPQVNVVQTSADGRMANLDLNVGAVGTIANAIGVLVTGIISTLGTSGVVVTTNAMISIADAHLDRNMALGPDSSGTGTGPRTPRQSYRALRNHWQVGTDGVYTSFKEDDSTISFAKSVISTNSANLITGLS